MAILSRLLLLQLWLLSGRSQQILPILPLHAQRGIELEDNFRDPQPIGNARRVYRSAQASAICNSQVLCGMSNPSSATCHKAGATETVRQWGMSIPQHWSYQKQDSWDTFYDQRGWPNECYHETKNDTYPGESPIDIPPAATDLVPEGVQISLHPGFGDRRSLLGISNNGHSVTVSICSNFVDCRATASFGIWPKKVRHVPSLVADEYFLLQFHFHWGSDNSKGSEHLVCGHSRAAEMHMVFMNGRKVPSDRTNADSGTFLAVLGVMIEGGAAQDNAAFNPIIDYLQNAQQQNGRGLLPGPLVLADLLPDDYATKYYTYPGSLTTPPCSQRVTWFLAENFVRLSDRQLERLRSLQAQTTWRGHGGTSSKALLFPFVALAMGTATQHLLSRYAPFLPYTVTIMCEGAFIDWLANQNERCKINPNATIGFCSQQITPGQCGLRPPAGCSMQDSLDMWANIDGHLLLMVFLPVLLFGDAMTLDVHVFKKTFWQCLLLACPGVVFGTFGLGIVAYYILPYGWTWNLSMAFGAIVSATDPVAVVALLKAVGASETLTMQIIGESLINDGTAMVMFSLFFSMHMDWGICDPFDPLNCVEANVGNIIGYFMRMSIAGPALGLVFGALAYFWMNRASRSHNHIDTTIQTSITVFTAYLAFYTAEQELFMSGVLCVVAAAVFLARYCWPIVVSQKALQNVWHAFEYFGNTLIFILAGVLTRRAMLNSWIDGVDFLWCFFMFLAMLAVRGIMVLLFYPILARIGAGTNLKDSSFMVWGGLRGAVGLSLAAFSRISLMGVDNQAGAQVIFLVAGLAFLTLVINGVSSGPLLKKCKMVGISETKQLLLQKVADRVCEEVCDSYEKICLELEFDAVDCIDLVPGLKKIRGTRRAEPNKDELSSMKRVKTQRAGFSWSEMESCITTMSAPDEVCIRTMRETFMRIVRMEYWKLMRNGSLPRKSEAALELLSSVSQALDNNNIALHDWELLHHIVYVGQQQHRLQQFFNVLQRILPSWVTWDENLHYYLKLTKQEEAYFATASFIEAHRNAQNKLALSFSESPQPRTSEEATVVLESMSQVELAEERLAHLSKDLVNLIKTKIVVSRVEESMYNCIENLVQEGILIEAEAEMIIHRVDAQHGDVQKLIRAKTQSLSKVDLDDDDDGCTPPTSPRLFTSVFPRDSVESHVSLKSLVRPDAKSMSENELLECKSVGSVHSESAEEQSEQKKSTGVRDAWNAMGA